jgi:hypothetical protein
LAGRSLFEVHSGAEVILVPHGGDSLCCSYLQPPLSQGDSRTTRMRDVFRYRECFRVRGHFAPRSFAVFASASPHRVSSSPSSLDGGLFIHRRARLRTGRNSGMPGRTNSTQRRKHPLRRTVTSTVTENSRTQHANGVAATVQKGVLRTKWSPIAICTNDDLLSVAYSVIPSPPLLRVA